MKKHAIVTDAPRPAQAPLEKRPRPLVGARFLLGVASEAQLPREGAPEIAFAGRSNAGKSSAINALAKHGRLAFASRTPGRTQQINMFTLRSGALVADLPGYGYAAVSKSVKRDWQAFLWQYVSTRNNLVALVLMVDARHGISDHDLPVLDAIVPTGRPVLILATKADKLGKSAQREALAAIVSAVGARYRHGNVIVQLFSATTRQGVEEAEDVIDSWL
ncbi:MAG: ribosome biogenesis GTP-binding protein YihA/YsxC [Casimicrobiaceae bacterium]